MSAEKGRSGGSMRETPTGPTDRPGEESPPGPRREVGGAASSQRHPPHVTENVEGAPVQESGTTEEPIPALPPNAHGKDRTDATGQPPIEEESMYEGRPEEDKDQPPSARAR